MAVRREGEALRWLDAASREGAVGAMTDGQLLARVRESSGQASDLAFEVLVRRHGPQVLARCRGIVRDEHAADDAFQATFLVLARRASTVRDPDRLAPWLDRVARRIALRARRDAADRRAREGRRLGSDREPGPIPVATTTPAAILIADETAALVRAAVDRLPERDRRLMHLTYWQGKTYEEAAALLRWPIGTVRSRLARVRERLRGSLVRGGQAPGLIPLGIVGRSTLPPPAEPSAALVARTVRVASGCLGGESATLGAGVVPASVAALVEGELKMTMLTGKSVAALLIVGGALGVGTVSLAQRVTNPPPPASPALAPVAQVAQVAQAEAKPPLVNGGFEEGQKNAPSAWEEGAAVPGVEYLWSRTVAHGGKASLALKKTAQRYFPIAEWTQRFDRAGDLPRLKVSAWIKAEKAGKAIVDAQFLDGDGNMTHAWVSYIGARKGNDPPASHDWKRYEGVVAIPPGTKQIIVAPRIYGPGTVWFDDLKAEYTNDPAIDPTAS